MNNILYKKISNEKSECFDVFVTPLSSSNVKHFLKSHECIIINLVIVNEPMYIVC